VVPGAGVIALAAARTTGGTGRHVRALAAAIDDCLVVAPRSAEQAFHFSAVARYEPVDIGTGPRPADLAAIRRLRRLLAGADLVHAHGLRAATLATFATPRATPLIVTLHNRVAPRWTALERRAPRPATVILAVSPDLADRAKALGGNDVRVAPVGARRPETTRPPDEVRTELDASDRPLIVAAGRLTEQKNYDLLLQAATHYELRTPRPKTVIAGDGPLRATLADLAQCHDLDVTLLGNRPDVPDLLAAADVVAITSTWEGSPLTAHEALFAGRPIVATAVGGLPAMLEGAALLVDPSDARGFADAVESILDNPATAATLATSARHRANEWPDEQATVNKVLAVYEEVRRAATAAND
jgi:glycosyltransferase involved in cell wall biosynthesis